MTKTTFKTKLISLLIMLTMLVGMMPLSGIISFAEGASSIVLSQDYIEIPYAKHQKIPEYIKENITVSYSEGGVVPPEYITIEAVDGVATVTVEGREPATINYSINDMVLTDVYVDDYMEIKAMPEEINNTLIRDHIDLAAKVEFDNELGYITIGLLDIEFYIYSIDTDQKIIFIAYEDKVLSVEYTEFVRPELTVGEPLVVSAALFGTEHTYVNFTPTESATYMFTSSSTTDPAVRIYKEDGEYLHSADDDYGSQFALEVHLEAGQKYYLRVNDWLETNDCEITVSKMCEVHTPDGQTCRGYHCSVCNCYYGEALNHSLSDEQTCIGYQCIWCLKMFGEGNDVHVDDDKNYKCDVCDVFCIDTDIDLVLGTSMSFTVGSEVGVPVRFVAPKTGKYILKSENNGTDPYAYIYDNEFINITVVDDEGGKRNFIYEMELNEGDVRYVVLYDYTDSSEVTVFVHEECSEHVKGAQNCLGYRCTTCFEYFGEKSTVHAGDEDGNNKCDLCGDFTPEIVDTLTENEELNVYIYNMQEKYVFVKFVPTETGTYTFVSQSDIDPQAWLFNSDEHSLIYSDDVNGLNFQFDISLTAGESYYLRLSAYSSGGDITVKVYKKCDEHVPGEQYCIGYLCTACGEYFGEVGEKHVGDEDGDSQCDGCFNFYPEVIANLTSGDSLALSLIYNERAYLTFNAESDGEYIINCGKDSSVIFTVRSQDGESIFTGEAYGSVDLTAGIYYIELWAFVEDVDFTLSVIESCEEHTPGETSCLGTLCTVCGAYFGETSDHVIEIFDGYEVSGHYGQCVVCANHVYGAHSFNEDNLCDCGYRYHDHEFTEYGYNPSSHWLVCGVCGMEDMYEDHEYDENGECVCGRVLLAGIMVGDVNVTDGEYIDNYGNVSLTRPSGGYAYYNDGVLTLNSFTFVSYSDNSIEDYYAIYSETDLSLVIVGENYLETAGCDVVHVVGADLTISGDGTLNLVSFKVVDEEGSSYSGDGIDVNGGTLIINSGNLIIDSSDHGIEVKGDTEINGGIIKITAADDGMDVDDIVINGGSFYIDAEDHGIDSGNSFTINGGSFYISTNDDNGIDVSDVLTINDGTFEIYANDICLASYGTLIINGGYMDLYSTSDDTVIMSENELVISEDLGEFNIIYDDYYYCGYILVNEEDETFYYITIKSSENEDKMLILNGWVSVESNFIPLNNENFSLDL